MKDNSSLPRRRSIRLHGYDYGLQGMYFVTICTHHRKLLFGEITNGKMLLSPFGDMAHQEWEKIPERWPHITLGAFQVMPNHLHGILIIERPASNRMIMSNESPEEYPFSKLQWATRPVLGQVLGAYKSMVFKACRDYYQEQFPGVGLDNIWQRGFFERIIRNEVMFRNVTNYIIKNPKKWELDMLYSNKKKEK